MRKRQRTSVIWSISNEEFKKIVNQNNSFADIIRHFGLVVASSNYNTLKKRLKEENIDYSHIPQGIDSNKNKVFPERAIPLEEVMIENSTYCRGTLKRRLLKNGILKNQCSNCKLAPLWDNQKLVMVLDHINGINNDHRLENLRLLCPNCNSQQKTFSGRNSRKKYNCQKCGKETTRKRKYCNICCQENNSLYQRKVKNRPSKEQLLKEIKETNYCAVGRKYGVSDNAVRKWLK